MNLKEAIKFIEEDAGERLSDLGLSENDVLDMLKEGF
jgi:hypothetical protein